jgi:2-dehydropantoate 2-reductase
MIPAVLVAGCGAMGVLFSAILAESNVNVYVVDDWLDGINALTANGARYIDSKGKIHTAKVYASNKISTMPEVNIAFLLVKSWQTEKACLDIKSRLAKDGICVTLQNGLGNFEIVKKVLGNHRAAAGTTTLGSFLVEPGLAHIHGKKRIILARHPAINPIHDLLIKADFKVELEQNLDGILWGKLIVNAAINPLTAILEIRNGDLLKYPHLQYFMEQIIKETVQITEKLGIRLPYENPNAYVYQVIQQTSDNRSSMLQDFNRGAQTEIDAITGQIIHHGEKNGIPTPFNRAVYALLKTRLEVKLTNLIE